MQHEGPLGQAGRKIQDQIGKLNSLKGTLEGSFGRKGTEINPIRSGTRIKAKTMKEKVKQRKKGRKMKMNR